LRWKFFSQLLTTALDQPNFSSYLPTHTDRN
jgi:hypothetical protein